MFLVFGLGRKAAAERVDVVWPDGELTSRQVAESAARDDCHHRAALMRGNSEFH